jgi:uncharacterized membrane-anchored protein YjiN (DUF445 family)
MAALTISSYALPPGWPASLLQASAKAGFVGGVADWFAVVALFRHPLGLPIPHTAIIPAQKQRLGQALGRFLARHVVTGTEVERVLGRFDVAGFLQALLRDPAVAEPLARTLAGYVPRLLASLQDGRARRLMARLLPRLLGGPGAGRVLSRALRTLVEGGRHQEVLSFLLVRLREALAAKETQLHALIEERVREQGGRLVGWAIGAAVADRVIAAIGTELDKVGPESSELREAFDEWARREIERMETDPERAAEIGRALRGLLAHDTVQAWFADVWSRLRLALEADAARPNGHIVSLLQAAIAGLGETLAEDEAARARLQRAAERIVLGMLPSLQAQLSAFTAGVVGAWDTRTITERLELSVGKDLQYVRVNGTLVGFLVGGALYAALRLAFGYAAF